MIEVALRTFYYMIVACLGLWIGISLYLPLRHIAQVIGGL